MALARRRAHFMTHLARWEAAGEGLGPETTWREHISDAGYGSR
jgi:hypothetical protein